MQRAHDPYSFKWRMHFEYVVRLAKEGRVEIPYVSSLEEAEEYCTSPPLRKMTVRGASLDGDVGVVGHLPGLNTFMPLHVNTLLRLLHAVPLTTASLLPRRDQARVVLRRGTFEAVKEQLQSVVACEDRFIIFKDKWMALTYCQSGTEKCRIVNLERGHDRCYKQGVCAAGPQASWQHSSFVVPEHFFVCTGQLY
jgi:hypothetical protein